MARNLRPGITAGMILAAAAASGCLLYTDPINEPPAVSLDLPSDPVYRRQTVEFRARVRDDATSELTYEWQRAAGSCDDPGANWTSVSFMADVAKVEIKDRNPFSLRVTVRDRHGATAQDCVSITPMNHPPTAKVEVATSSPPNALGPATAPALETHVALYSFVRLSARASDADDSQLTYTWDLRFGDEAVGPVACPTGAPASELCFRPERAGTYRATVRVSDGSVTSSSPPFELVVDEDAPPCLEQSDPDLATRALVIALSGSRRFEVRRVRDDGHPFPAGAFGGTRFVWSIARGAGPWLRRIGHDGAGLEIGAALFDDVRPGERVRVRVEPRDPAHEDTRSLAALDAACGDAALCEAPMGCVRWASWTVEFR